MHRVTFNMLYYKAMLSSKMISPTLTSLISQRRQFGLNCKKNIALKFAYKIVALFTENYPSYLEQWLGTIDFNVGSNTFWMVKSLNGNIFLIWPLHVTPRQIVKCAKQQILNKSCHVKTKFNKCWWNLWRDSLDGRAGAY